MAVTGLKSNLTPELDKQNVHASAQTADGSVTLYSDEFGEHYHSLKDGALTETLYKHVIPAYTYVSQKGLEEVSVLDICFGLGYNTLATLYYFRQQGFKGKIYIESPEMDESLITNLANLEYPGEFSSLLPVIDALSKNRTYRDESNEVKIVIGDAREMIKETKTKYHVVYQDPFSPKKNPLLWTEEYFTDIKVHLYETSILTTYSQATPVRMGLYKQGFYLFEQEVERIRPGTIASLEQISGLKPIDMALKLQRNPLAKALHDSDFSAS